MTGQIIEDFIGGRRNRYGQSAEKDDPGRQRMGIGSVVPGLPVIMARRRNTGVPFVTIAIAIMPTAMVALLVIVAVRLVMLLPLGMVPLIAVMIVAVPSVGHGCSAEKRQCHRYNDNRF